MGSFLWIGRGIRRQSLVTRLVRLGVDELEPRLPLAVTPGLPRGIVATPGDSQVSLSWSPPARDGGAAITDYLIEYRASLTAPWLTFPDGRSSMPKATVNSLTNATPYTFRVSALNSVGLGAPVISAAVTPVRAQIPTAPTEVTAQLMTGGALLSVAWTATTATNGSAATGYQIQISQDGGRSWRNGPTSTTTKWTPLRSELGQGGKLSSLLGTSCTFRVAATNTAGISAYSSQSVAVTPWDRPDAPIQLTGTLRSSGSGITLSWTPPRDNGSAITEYQIKYFRNDRPSLPQVVRRPATTTPSVMINGLQSQSSYMFIVCAKNAAGFGEESVITAIIR